MKPGSGTLVIDISGEKAEAYEGTYQCTAHNEHGTAVSNRIVIRQSSKTIVNNFISIGLCNLTDSSRFCFHKMLNLIAFTERNECDQYHHEAMGSLQYLCLMLCDSQGPPCGRRRETRPSWCRWGSPWCCSAGPLQGCPLLSSSGWITVSHLHVHTHLHTCFKDMRISQPIQQRQTNKGKENWWKIGPTDPKSNKRLAHQHF